MIKGGFIPEIFHIGRILKTPNLPVNKVDCRKLETRLEQDCSKCHCIVNLSVEKKKKYQRLLSYNNSIDAQFNYLIRILQEFQCQMLFPKIKAGKKQMAVESLQDSNWMSYQKSKRIRLFCLSILNFGAP